MIFTKRELSHSSPQSNIFLKINDGESVTGVLRGEVYEFSIKWVDGKPVKSSKNAPTAKPHFRVNFILSEGEHFVPKVWEFGIIVNNKLADVSALLADVDRDITQTKIKITRHGIGLDTEYSISPLAREPLSKNQLEHIKALKLNLLNLEDQKEEPEAPRNWPESPMPEAEDELGF